MSSKTLAARYGGNGGGSISTEPNIRDIIAKITGKDSVTGGYEVNAEPSGEQSYKFSPFVGQTGWLGAGSRRDAAARNMAAMQMLMQIQEQKKSALLTQAQRAKLEAENLQLQYALANKNMLSQEEQKRITDRLQQNNIVLQSTGVVNRGPESTEDAKVFGDSLNNQRIRNALLNAKNQEVIMTNPKYDETSIAGANAVNLAPVIANFKNMQVPLAPNQGTAFADIGRMGRPDMWPRLMGPKEEQTVETQVDPLTGMMKGSKVLRSYSNPSVKIPADPALLQQAPTIDFDNTSIDTEPSDRGYRGAGAGGSWDNSTTKFSDTTSVLNNPAGIQFNNGVISAPTQQSIDEEKKRKLAEIIRILMMPKPQIAPFTNQWTQSY